MDMMSAAMGMMSLASAGQMSQYSATIQHMAMDAETASAQNMLNMLPSFQARGPQPGDVPAIQKGSILDIYA